MTEAGKRNFKKINHSKKPVGSKIQNDHKDSANGHSKKEMGREQTAKKTTCPVRKSGDDFKWQQKANAVVKPEGCDEAAGCPLTKKCGGCQFTKVPYTEQLKHKQMHMRKLLGRFGKVEPIIGMEQPLYYRHKVHAVLGRGRKGEIISGTYEARSHKIVPVEHCLIEDEKAQAVIATVRRLIKEFKLYIYDEDLGTGLMRHVLVRRGYATGEILVVLVTGTVVFPGKNNFVKALVKEHPEITTIVQNINDRRTSVVLGEREQVLYGPGFIRDELCGFTFRISASSFYQVNPAQTEKLYNTAIEMAGLTGKETVIDAYCGTGTIGIAASRKAGRVIGVEVNKAAVRDARLNLKDNAVKNMTVKQDDAGRFMLEMAARGEKADVVLMDPPRTGSDKNFLSAVTKMGPDRIVYISCGPDTLARDLGILTKSGYRVMRMQPVDLFPQTEHIENVVLLSNKKSHR